MTNRTQLARASAVGTSVGDAFGNHFDFDTSVDSPGAPIDDRTPDGPWHYTDDAWMAFSVYEVLAEKGEIDPDRLAKSFVKRFQYSRKYGASVVNLLERLSQGGDWRALAPAAFSGSGSWGNGAAMRASPIGAYFWDDLTAVIRNATASAIVTHSHPLAIDGAVTIAVATALITSADNPPRSEDFTQAILGQLRPSELRDRVERTLEFDSSCTARVVSEVGNGSTLAAADTVPLVIWSVAHFGSDFETAIRRTAAALGDVDTTCAMVGGILGCAKWTAPPDHWLTRVEPPPPWAPPATKA